MKEEKDRIVLIMALLAAALVMTGLNAFQVNLAGSDLTGRVTTGHASIGSIALAGPSVVPTGVPDIYGSELGISYDDVSASNQARANQIIAKLGGLDNSITLNSDQEARYINILYKLQNGISCEYCCDAQAVIFQNGQPACGCAHSYAMRGLAKYLITKHGSKYTDEQILAEIAKWKVLFFPTQMQNKYEILKSNGLETDYTSLGSNKYGGIENKVEQGSSADSTDMVGGC